MTEGAAIPLAALTVTTIGIGGLTGPICVYWTMQGVSSRPEL